MRQNIVALVVAVGALFAAPMIAAAADTMPPIPPKALGKVIAERAKAKGVSKVVFDRGGYIYHGRVKALADAAREAGLQF